MEYVDVLMKIIKRESFTDEEIARALDGMCEEIHSSCDDRCIMMAKGFMSDDLFQLTGHCPYFRSGKAMLVALRNLKEVKDSVKRGKDDHCRTRTGW